jgi:hypothetical protein
LLSSAAYSHAVVLAFRDGFCQRSNNRNKSRLSSGPSCHDVNWHERGAFGVSPPINGRCRRSLIPISQKNNDKDPRCSSGAVSPPPAFFLMQIQIKGDLFCTPTPSILTIRPERPKPTGQQTTSTSEHLEERRLMVQWWADYLYINAQGYITPYDFGKSPI